MTEYHKIDSLFKRDQKGKMLWGEFSRPEFEYLWNNRWVFTEKVDGTNVRVLWDGEKINFGGRTDSAQMPTFLLARLNELFPAEKMAGVFTGPACLYGEGYGAKIQKGGGNYKADGVDFVLFDIRIGDWWLRREDVDDIAVKLGIRSVPIVGIGDLQMMVDMVSSGGFQSAWGGFVAEGIVARPEVELKDRAGHRIITKIKVRDFGQIIPTERNQQ